VHTVAAAKAQVALRESDHAAALAMVASAKPSWTRPAPPGPLRNPGQGRRRAVQELDDDRARVRGAEAALKAAQAQAAAAKAAIEAARPRSPARTLP
jgi:HlyD family secretion protein